MKKINLTAVFLFLGLGGCGLLGGSEAFKAYQKFEDAMRRGNCGEMQALVESGGTAQAQVDALCTSTSITVYGKTINTGSAASMIADMNSTPAGAMRKFVHSVQSETASGDSGVSLVVKCSVVGRSTPMNPLPAPVMDTVTLKKVGGVWKLTEFSRK